MDFYVLLFAGDINVYSVARAFNDEYGIIPKVYGKYKTFPCAFSRIMDYTNDYKADTREGFLRIIREYAFNHKDLPVILMGCGDSYVQLIGDLKSQLPSNFIVPVIDGDLIRNLTHKEKFYERLEENDIPFPKTFVHKKEFYGSFELPFDFPCIVKPSNGIAYWAHPFPTQKKVYKAETREELNGILGQIYGAGYDDSIIVQDFVPGDDSFMRVLTCYSDRKGKVKMMCMGHVLLEEHTPHGLGNHAVIITEPVKAVEENIRKFLDETGYVGFSNFDIKYDERDNKYKVFEINVRQGRSNYYVTGSGENIAKLVVRDFIHEMDIPFRTVTEENLFMVVPKGVALKYVENPVYRGEILRLIREKKAHNPLFNRKDLGLKHLFYLLKNYFGHYHKYKKYLGKTAYDKGK